MNKPLPRQSSSQLKKRQFLKQTLTGSLAALTLPFAGSTMPNPHLDLAKINQLAQPEEEKYWELIKKQFTIPESLVMINAANLCPSPYFVTEKVLTTQQQLEKDVSFQHRAIFSEGREATLNTLAAFLNVQPEEVGITRNTTESNNIIVNGMDLQKGDEILLWDQNHPTNLTAWEQRAKRYGFTVKLVTLPETINSPQDIVDTFAKAINKKTRLLSFSHISNTSGIAMPAKELCTLAAERDMLSMVDGAQSFGMMNLDLKDLGCDFYSGSTHKWLMGPLENGVLYIKKEHMPIVWPMIVGAGWEADSATVDQKYCILGQRNETTTLALSEILNFHTSLGRQAIENRTKALNAYLKKQVQEKIPTAQFVTPISPELSAGVTILGIPDKDSHELFDTLYSQYGVACAPTGGLRFSPHIYNTMADIDTVVEALQKA